MFPTSHKGFAKHFDGLNCDLGNVAVLGRIFVAGTPEISDPRGKRRKEQIGQRGQTGQEPLRARCPWRAMVTAEKMTFAGFMGSMCLSGLLCNSPFSFSMS
jgi:hypothetical protein